MAKKGKTNKKKEGAIYIVQKKGTQMHFGVTGKGRQRQYYKGTTKATKSTYNKHTGFVSPPKGQRAQEIKAVRQKKRDGSWGEWRPNTAASTYDPQNVRSWMPKKEFEVPKKMKSRSVGNVNVSTPKTYQRKKKK